MGEMANLINSHILWWSDSGKLDEFTPSPYMSICYLGPVYEHRLMMEHTGANRGYGYVRFTNTEVRESECYSYRVLF